MAPFSVCIIGGGVQGLAALKNLLELSEPNEEPVFDAELLETKDHIGGLWKFTEDSKDLTALATTLQNASKFKNCYSDFPVYKAWEYGGRKGKGSVFLDQEEAQFYLEQYAKKFDLKRHVRFGSKVLDYRKDEQKNQWEVDILDVRTGAKNSKMYDKIIIATGQYSIEPNMPKINGIENFKGQLMHSGQFKSTAPFKGKRVVVIGFSNTAADQSTAVASVASSVTVSHRRGGMAIPRVYENKPFDQTLNRRTSVIIKSLVSLSPAYITHKVLDPLVLSLCRQAWNNNIPEEMSIETAPYLSFSRPMLSDNFVPMVREGKIKLAPAIRHIREDGTIEFEDGETTEADTILCCTGYLPDRTLTRLVEREGEFELAKLYQNVYHPAYPDSLAFMTFWHLPTGICDISDLMAMGIAQVFSGRYKLPGRKAMEKQIETHVKFIDSTAYYSRPKGPISQTGAEKHIDEGPWRWFLNDAAGTGVNENLGYGIQGWKFWLSDPKFCNLLMTGVDSMHFYRLFDGRKGARKKWDGAREAIKETNRELAEFVKMMENMEDKTDLRGI